MSQTADEGDPQQSRHTRRVDINRLMLCRRLGNNDVCHLKLKKITTRTTPRCCGHKLRLVKLVFLTSKTDDLGLNWLAEKRRFQIGALMMQLLLKEEMGRRFREPSLTFDLEFDGQIGSLPVCHRLQLERNVEELNCLTEDEFFWNVVVESLLASNLFAQNAKFLCCASSTIAAGRRRLNLGRGQVALFSAGLAFEVWPTRAADVLDTLRSGELGRQYAKSLATVLHELGHVFDLVHTQRGLMSGDVSGIYDLLCRGEKSPFAAALLAESCVKSLYYNPWINRKLLPPSGPVNVVLDRNKGQLKSSEIIALVELRKVNGCNETVVKFWDLAARRLKTWSFPNLICDLVCEGQYEDVCYRLACRTISGELRIMSIVK